MSNTVVRRNSSKQGLQNLMRLMTQRSIEDAEELERERRQRAREALRMNGCSAGGESSAENEAPADRSGWKPGNSWTLEEDEGFADWTRRRTQQMQEDDGVGEEANGRAAGFLPPSSTSSRLQRQPEAMWNQGEAGRRAEGEEEVCWRVRGEEDRRRTEEGQRSDPEKMKEAEVSCKVFLRQEEIQKSLDSGDATLHMKATSSNTLTKMPIRTPLPKIDDKMEQYTQAVESSQEVRSVKTPPRSAEVVANRKSLFEVGDARNQTSSKAVSWKDTDGLKVGVAELISQWVKGQSEDSSRLSCRVTDVKPGDVMQKKNLWEEIRDSSTQTSKASTASKKYKFVVTGHGKYQKMAAEGDTGSEPIW